MANKQSRRTISVGRPIFEEARAHAAEQGRPLSQLGEEGLRLAMASAKPPEVFAEFVDAMAGRAAAEQWNAGTCIAEMRRMAADLRGEPPILRSKSTATPPVERSPRLAGVPKIEIKRAGGYDPKLGPKHPNNQDPTLGRRVTLADYESTLASVGWSPEQITAEKRRRAAADPKAHRRAVGAMGCLDNACPVCRESMEAP